MDYLPHFAGSYDLAPSKFVTSARQLFTECFERPRRQTWEDATEAQHARLFTRLLTAWAFEAWATLSPDVSFLSNSEPVDLRTSPIPPYNNSSIGLGKETGQDKTSETWIRLGKLPFCRELKKKTRTFENIINRLTQSLSYHWKWTLQAACSTTSIVCFSWMLTVKHLFWLKSWRRNRISFVSFKIRVSLIWRVLLVWSWWNRRLWGSQFPSTYLLGHAYLSLELSSRSFIPLPPHTHDPHSRMRTVHGFFSQPNLWPGDIRFCETYWLSDIRVASTPSIST